MNDSTCRLSLVSVGFTVVLYTIVDHESEIIMQESTKLIFLRLL